MSEQDANGYEEEATAQPESPTAGLDAAIESAQQHLRGVLEQATNTARDEVSLAAAALIEREAALEKLEATALAEKTSLDLQREEVLERLAAASARQRLSESQLEEANNLNDRASETLAGAMERSAVMMEETEKRIEDDEARAKAMCAIELDEAKSAAAAIHKQAASRLEAVSAETEVVLKRAVDRAREIVAMAQKDSERSKAELRGIVSHVEEFLKRVPASPEFDLAEELSIDVRSGGVELDENDPEHAETSDDDGAELEESQPLVSVGTAEASEEIAADQAMDAYFNGHEAAAEPVDEEKPQIVADAVRRAVKEWSTSRQKAQ